jgi:hypothetical protein
MTLMFRQISFLPLSSRYRSSICDLIIKPPTILIYSFCMHFPKPQALSSHIIFLLHQYVLPTCRLLAACLSFTYNSIELVLVSPLIPKRIQYATYNKPVTFPVFITLDI